MTKVLLKGNDAIGAAAIEANCRCYFGYPITPQNEICEYFSEHMPKAGGVFIQAESEIAAINMVYGAASTGVRAMTSSSSPGISLKMEGLSYIAGSELPCVVANIMRGGPGLGGIQPSQSDYFQATKGGGHGDYRLIVLAPAGVQELYDYTKLAFYLADKYRNPVMLLGDGFLGQMMEVVVKGDSEESYEDIPKPWATDGCKGREKNIINSLYLDPEVLENHNKKLQEKYRQIEENEQRVELYQMDDAELVIVSFGIAARIAKEAVDTARQNNIKVGLIRPISLWPFPKKAFEEISNIRGILTVEMNAGQMIEDVKLAVNGRVPVYFHGRTGGMLPNSADIINEIQKIGGAIS